MKMKCLGVPPNNLGQYRSAILSAPARKTSSHVDPGGMSDAIDMKVPLGLRKAGEAVKSESWPMQSNTKSKGSVEKRSASVVPRGAAL